MYEDRLLESMTTIMGRKTLAERFFVLLVMSKKIKRLFKIFTAFRFGSIPVCRSIYPQDSGRASCGPGADRERITQELIGLLEAKHPLDPLNAMFDSQIMIMVLPDARGEQKGYRGQ